ncbi:MAG: hypothetical protein PHN51_05020 [Candidatus Nanopelagicales bacterium]|nr:hypothetical protein [Candidatus Nanopelagicales bacterium]
MSNVRASPRPQLDRKQELNPQRNDTETGRFNQLSPFLETPAEAELKSRLPQTLEVGNDFGDHPEGFAGARDVDGNFTV